MRGLNPPRPQQLMPGRPACRERPSFGLRRSKIFAGTASKEAQSH